ncbi:unnamed protein product [Lactuca virosa]|uniref:Uncharacterized protein n=1 Tax=Lactuca virosa TaxID=75947 RepID=A0AAU9PXF7_9ASTR|nr:unnamed protein product [Lactuca virosa]
MTLVRDRWFQVFCRMGGGGEFDRGCLLIRETQQLSTQGKRGRIQWFFCCEFDGKEESICFWLGMKMQADTKDRSIFTVRVQLLLDCL